MNIKCAFLLFIAAVTGLLSCKNNDNIFKPVVYANINVVNASPNALNFYLNGTRQNNASSLFPGSFTLYVPQPAGLQNYQFKLAGNPSVLFSIPLNLGANTYNSLYVAGETADKAFNIVDMLLTDTLPNTCTVRFVNAAPDAGNLDITVGDTAKFQNRPFKSSSEFLATGSGQKTVKIYQTGTSIPKVDTIIALQPNRVYTLFAKGLLNGKGNAAFDVGVILNGQ